MNKIFSKYYKILLLLVVLLIIAFFINSYNTGVISFLQTKFTKKALYSPNTPPIDKIFAENHTWVATLSAQNIRVLIATGDIIPARSVNSGVINRNNPLWPYEKVGNFFKTVKHDIVFINLEAPFVKNCPVVNEGMIFCSDVKNIDGLKHINTSVANLANNHLGNYGIDGINSTKEILQKANIKFSGTSEPVFVNIRGLNFAFLGYNDVGPKESGITFADKDLIQKEIKEAREKSDIVVVAFHFGTEYQSQPDKRQIDLTHFAIDQGADLIIGNHPHWIQPIEIYKDKFITYAHGNFVFDQMWSEKTKEGVLGKYTFFDKKLIDVEFFPVKIEDYGQPYLLSGEQKKIILDEMKTESIQLKKSFKGIE